MTDLMFLKGLNKHEMLCAASFPIPELTDGGLKFCWAALLERPGWLVLVEPSVFKR